MGSKVPPITPSRMRAMLRGGRARGARASALVVLGVGRAGGRLAGRAPWVGGAYFWAVPRKDQVTPRRKANATRAMTPKSHGGIGSSRAVGSSSVRKRATVIDMRASLAPRLSTEVVHSPVHDGALPAYGLWTTRRALRYHTLSPRSACAAPYFRTRNGVTPPRIEPTPRRRSGSWRAGRTDNDTDLARLVREGRGGLARARHDARDGVGVAADDLSRSPSLPGRRHRRVADPAVTAAGTDRLDTSALAGRRGPPISYSGALSQPCPGARPGGPGLPLAHDPRPGRPERRRPDVRRGGGPPAARGAAAPGGRRLGRARTRSSASTTAPPTPRRCCCSGCAASGRRCGWCGCGPTPGTRPPSRPAWPGPGAPGSSPSTPTCRTRPR